MVGRLVSLDVGQIQAIRFVFTFGFVNRNIIFNQVEIAMLEEKQTCSLPPEFCPHVKEAADAAVKQVFAILGVDVDVPREVEQFRENLRFGASMRRAADKGMLAIIGAVAVAGLAALWAGIVSIVVKSH